VPDARIAWGDVWVGAAITSRYSRRASTSSGSIWAAAASRRHTGSGLAVVLIGWVYYAAQIFFFGAELTQAYSRRHGSRAPALRSLFQPADQPGLLAPPSRSDETCPPGSAPAPGSGGILRGASFALLRETDR
jgi:hypothetical protein